MWCGVVWCSVVWWGWCLGLFLWSRWSPFLLSLPRPRWFSCVMWLFRGRGRDSRHRCADCDWIPCNPVARCSYSIHSSLENTSRDNTWKKMVIAKLRLDFFIFIICFAIAKFLKLPRKRPGHRIWPRLLAGLPQLVFSTCYVSPTIPSGEATHFFQPA